MKTKIIQSSELDPGKGLIAKDYIYKKYKVTWVEELRHTSIIELCDDMPPREVIHEMSNSDAVTALRKGRKSTEASTFGIKDFEIESIE